MPGLDPGIHSVTSRPAEALMEWIAGSSPAMTKPLGRKALDQAFEHLGAVGAAEALIGEAFRMGH